MLGTFSPEAQKRTDAIDTSFTMNFSWPSFFLSVYFVWFFTDRSCPLYACFAGFTLFAPLLFRAGELCLVQKKYFLHLCLPLLTIGPPTFPFSQRSLSPMLLLVHSSAPKLCCLLIGRSSVSDLYYLAMLFFPLFPRTSPFLCCPVSLGCCFQALWFDRDQCCRCWWNQQQTRLT